MTSTKPRVSSTRVVSGYGATEAFEGAETVTPGAAPTLEATSVSRHHPSQGSQGTQVHPTLWPGEDCRTVGGK